MSSSAPIEFWNRDSGRMEEEQVYGEKWLRWTYEHPLGRSMLETVVKRPWFSRWYGRRMNHPKTRALIEPFIADYGLDRSEFAGAESFESFNAFFMRELRGGARPIDTAPEAVVFPADGRHLAIPDLSRSECFFIKGESLRVTDLISDPELVGRFAEGSAVLSRLCPVDYHRFHFPAAGTPSEPEVMPGWLYSVSPIALRRSLRYLTANHRVLTRLRTETLGEVLTFEIGATNVGSIQQGFQPDQWVEKGQEKGWFEFGGSAVLTLFEPGRIKLADDLLECSREGIEVYAKMGDRLGMATDSH